VREISLLFHLTNSYGYRQYTRSWIEARFEIGLASSKP